MTSERELLVRHLRELLEVAENPESDISQLRPWLRYWWLGAPTGEEISAQWFWRGAFIYGEGYERKYRKIGRQPEIGEPPGQCGGCQNADYSAIRHNTPAIVG